MGCGPPNFDMAQLVLQLNNRGKVRGSVNTLLFPLLLRELLSVEWSSESKEVRQGLG